MKRFGNIVIKDFNLPFYQSFSQLPRTNIVHTLPICNHNHSHDHHNRLCNNNNNFNNITPFGACRHYYTSLINITTPYSTQQSNFGDPIFTIDTAKISYGPGAITEVGEIAKFAGLRRVAVFTDENVRKLPFFNEAIKSLKKDNIEVVIFDQVRVEPTDESVKLAIKFASDAKVDGFVSIGGGSVMDTCKAANLYSSAPTADFLDYVNPPIGKGLSPKNPLKYHIAIPTTSGTGSETTGLAIFDLLSMDAKTGIASRAIKPNEALIDPVVTKTLPSTVTAASGFDVLSHALESFTARHHSTRARAPAAPQRPMSQGSNAWSDIGCLQALKLVSKYIARAVSDPLDCEAREKMLFASTLAGVSFGNAGCHLPHGMSYPVSGLVKKEFNYPLHGYPESSKPMIPHGMSVILHSPSVFQFTAGACPERHIEAAEALGVKGLKEGQPSNEIGEAIAEKLIELMKACEVPSGLNAVGYTEKDIPELVERAFPQQRLIANAPLDVTKADLAHIYKNAMCYWTSS